MKLRGCVPLAALLWCASPSAAQSIDTIDRAVQEAVEHNLSLLAERLNLTVADAAIITARLRPNPVLSGSANSLDWLGTGFNEVNGAGPPEYAARVDFVFERGGKRALRTSVATTARTVVEAQLADTVRRLRLDVTIAAVDNDDVLRVRHKSGQVVDVLLDGRTVVMRGDQRESRDALSRGRRVRVDVEPLAGGAQRARMVRLYGSS